MPLANLCNSRPPTKVLNQGWFYRGCMEDEMGDDFAPYVAQLRNQLFLDRDEGEDLLAYAKRVLEQLDWMIDEQQKKREQLRKVVEWLSSRH